MSVMCTKEVGPGIIFLAVAVPAVHCDIPESGSKRYRWMWKDFISNKKLKIIFLLGWQFVFGTSKPNGGRGGAYKDWMLPFSILPETVQTIKRKTKLPLELKGKKPKWLF